MIILISITLHGKHIHFSLYIPGLDGLKNQVRNAGMQSLP